MSKTAASPLQFCHEWRKLALTFGHGGNMPNRPGIATLFVDALAMSVAANAVIAMRVTQMTFGVVDPKHEGALMVAEKFDTAAEATFAAARSIATGEPQYAAGRAVAIYRRRVDQNLQRLTRA